MRALDANGGDSAALDADDAAPPAAATSPRGLWALRALRTLPATYWLYLLGSACAYGAVVPFWFIGAKHIALRWKLSLAAADAFLLWPEGAIALIAPPFGWLIDRRQWSLTTRLAVSAASLGSIPLAHAALALAPLPPVVGVGTLGVGYAVVQNLIWASVPLVSPAAYLNLSAGMVGCAVNLLPMLLPACVLTGDGTTDLLLLAVVGAVGTGQ